MTSRPTTPSPTTSALGSQELRDRAPTRWIVSTPEKVAEAIIKAGPGGKAER